MIPRNGCFLKFSGPMTPAWLVALCMPVLWQPLMAEEQEIAELVVRAARIPTPRSMLAASADRVEVPDTLRAFQELDFAEILESVPGLFVQSRHNASQDLRIDLRGFGARGNFGIRGIRVFVDGIPAGLPDGQVQVDSLDAADISSVEILRGPAAALYGNGAGGVILIETRPVSKSAPWHLSLGLGENGFTNHAGSFAPASAAGELAARVSLSRQHVAGYREQAGSDHRRIGAKMSARMGDRDRVEIYARATDAPLAQDPGGLSLEEFLQRPRAAARNNLRFDAGEVLDQQSIGWRWRRGSEADPSALELRNYFTWRDFENRLPFKTGGSVLLGRRLGGAGLLYGWRGAGNSDWVAGTEFDQQRDRRRRFDNDFGKRGALRLDQDETVTAAGTFVAANLPAGPFALQAALRFDTMGFELEDKFPGDGDDSGKRRFNQLSYGLGLQTSIGERAVAYTRFATAFDTPTTTELANPDGAGFSPTLNPQRSRAWELGWRYQGPRLRAELAVYQVDSRDELLAFELPSQPGRSFFENTGRSRRQGAEWSVAVNNNKGFSWRGSLAWTDATFRRFIRGGEDFGGRKLPGTPGLRFGGSFDWMPSDKLRLGADAERVWRVYANNANTVRSPDYFDLGVRIAYATRIGGSRVEYYLGIRNLLDELFADNLRINAFAGRFFEPAPARYFYGGMRLVGVR